ncbi:tetratricopeptide repeat-containing sensor histidine kinase [Reichenbachiella agariperforans]|uniref:tetratricopeptide repeat-containing sensor histidine kinase n=1 Tax=Reichenbachiella agariperforans TaxID=156994 RepID=UPI001C084F5F|nr:ATP-binding protein [Reichenbachiella agariperforans]MBU2912885.1 tetratricopeptide repeat protein [Reichenbachiella agariperforans]
MQIRNYLLALCLTLVGTSYAQSPILRQMIEAQQADNEILLDSLINQMYAKSSTLDWASYFDSLSASIDSDSILIDFYYDVAAPIITGKSASEAITLIDEGIRLSVGIDHKMLTAEGLELKAFALSQFGRFDESIALFYQALRLIDPKLHGGLYASTLANLASTLHEMGDNEKSIDYHRKSLAYHQDTGDLRGEALSYLGLGNAYSGGPNYDSALYYYEKTIKLSKPNGWNDLEAYSYGNMASVYLEQNLLQKAIDYQKKGLAMEEERNDELISIESHANLASAYAQLQNRDLAMYHLDRAKQIVEKYDAWHTMVMVYEIESEAYKSFGQYDLALAAYKQFKTLGDSLSGEEVQRNKLALQEQYEAEKKENEILTLQQQNQLATLDLEQGRMEKMRLTILAGVALLACGGFIFGFIQTRRSKRALDKRNLIITDINKKLNASQDALMESNKMKDKFFALIAHDIRGPLTSFQGIGRMLHYQMKKGDTQKVNQLIEQVDKSADKVNHLLDNLLKWTLNQLGTLPYQPQEINLQLLIDDAVTIFAPSARAKEVELIVDSIYEEEGVWVRADINMIGTVLRNLLSNAIKFTPRLGQVTIAIESRSDQLIVHVRDTGIGMSEEAKSRIMEESLNASATGTDGEKGTGLGLILCRKFVEIHGSQLNVTIHEGTTVSFSLELVKTSILHEQ